MQANDLRSCPLLTLPCPASGARVSVAICMRRCHVPRQLAVCDCGRWQDSAAQACGPRRTHLSDLHPELPSGIPQRLCMQMCARAFYTGQAAVRGRGCGSFWPPAGAAQPRRAVRCAVAGRPAAAQRRDERQHRPVRGQRRECAARSLSHCCRTVSCLGACLLTAACGTSAARATSSGSVTVGNTENDYSSWQSGKFAMFNNIYAT